MEDKILICKKCVGEKTHRGHHVKNASDILSKAATKKNKLKGLLDDAEEKDHTIHVLLEENRKNMLALVKDKFAKLRNMINKKEQEIASEIDLFFTKEKLQIDNQIHHGPSLRELIRTEIANLSQLEINDKLLKELEDDASLSSFSSSSQYDVVYRHSKQIQQIIENAFRNLISLVGSAIQEFKPLPNNLISLDDSVIQELEPLSSNLTSLDGSMIQESQLLPEFSIIQANQSQKSMTDVISAQNTIAKSLRIEIEAGWLVISPVNSWDNLLQIERNNISNLAKSKELNKVCLDFRIQKLDKEMMAAIAQIWTELRKITFVKLLLTNNWFTDQDLCDLCAYNFWCTSQVQSLFIYLVNTEINETGVKKLSQVIDGQNITSFTLDCSYSTFTDNCMKEIARNLVGNLKKLETLNLTIFRTSVGNSGIKEMYREMSRIMPTIKNLDLWLNSTAITDKSFEYFNQSLIPLGKNITYLSLHCPKLEGPEGNFIKAMIESIGKNLIKLKQFSLDYEKKGFTDETKKCIEDYKKNHSHVQTNF